MRENMKYMVVFFIFVIAFLFGENSEKDKELSMDNYCKNEKQTIIPDKPEIGKNSFYQINNIVSSDLFNRV